MTSEGVQVVVSIRGTSSLRDAVTDAVGQPLDIEAWLGDDLPVRSPSCRLPACWGAPRRPCVVEGKWPACLAAPFSSVPIRTRTPAALQQAVGRQQQAAG